MVDVAALEVGRLVFTQLERPLVEADPHLAAFSMLTGAHVIGLLEALGDYAIRAGRRAALSSDDLSALSIRPEAVEWHDALYTFWRTRYRSMGRLHEADAWPHDVCLPLPEPQRVVFQPTTREQLSNGYGQGLEQMTVSDLCTLLGRVSGYSAVAQTMPALEGKWIEGDSRMIHAHNKLVSFAQQPFTRGEFWKSEWEARRAYPTPADTAAGMAGSTPTP